MAQSLAATSAVFCDRDLFFHDGAKLHRIRLSRQFQALLFVVLLALVGWSAYATARMLTPSAGTDTAQLEQTTVSSDIARLAAATEVRIEQIEERQKLITAMIAQGGVDPDVIAKLGYSLPAPGQEGRGGPFDSASQADPTFKSLFTSWKKLDSLTDGAIAVPSDKPVKTAAFMSQFGLRTDPFEKRRKNHEGIDLAAPIGTPIYATADGQVTTATYGYNGGYGNIVKIDHGGRVETRYGHLSSIGVGPGQRVTRGQIIGRMGSTGRSTGSHLHYEVRIDGRAVNPVPFMRSTDYLLAMRNGTGSHSMDAVAVGGPSSAKR